MSPCPEKPEWAIPENIHTIPRTAFRISEGEGGEGGFTIMEFWGHGGGGIHFGISKGKGGLKLGSHLWLGMDIFWNCPIKILFQLRPEYIIIIIHDPRPNLITAFSPTLPFEEE